LLLLLISAQIVTEFTSTTLSALQLPGIHIS